jgi:hypothetical protein
VPEDEDQKDEDAGVERELGLVDDSLEALRLTSAAVDKSTEYTDRQTDRQADTHTHLEALQ